MQAGYRTNPARVLVVDDAPDNQLLLREIISGFGFDVITAGDGEEALRMIEGERPDIVLLDIMLPNMDGFEVCRRLKDRSETRDLPVIMLSALNEVTDKVEGFRAGAVDYIQKPWRTEELLVRLETHLARRRMGEKLEAQNRLLQEEILQRKHSQELVERHRRDLERRNQELEALHRISEAVNSTIDMEELFSEILQALRDIIGADLRGAIFLAEGERLRLASAISLSEKNLLPCQKVDFGQCLCGLAAQNGRILISTNSRKDPRHVLCNPGLRNHGHIVLPLMVESRVLGVLNLYTASGQTVPEGARMLLTTISNQIAQAVYNSRRFEEHRKYSLHDPLTGLSNRRFLTLQQDALLETVYRYGDPLSAIMLDIDHFKRFNDQFGHPEGDRILVKVAGILRKESRHADHVFRLGGEEFLVLLPRIALPDARSAAERLRHAAMASTAVTLSLGVATWEQGMGMEALIKQADAALYRAKQQGRNRVKAIPPSRVMARADQ